MEKRRIGIVFGCRWKRKGVRKGGDEDEDMDERHATEQVKEWRKGNKKTKIDEIK